MAEALVDRFGPEVAVQIGEMIRTADPLFDVEAFTAAALTGYAELGLTDRAQAICDALVPALPAQPCAAIELISASLPPRGVAQRWQGMDSFVLMPFGMYIAEYGLDCFEASMAAQYEITRRFTSEFSIRAFIEHRYEPTMARLRHWVHDPDEHVRRLVSEGTRPRLPWAGQLQAFRDDPEPVLELLEVLKDDPSDYVRRSVANNLNDIAKDHPERVVDLCRRWWPEGSPERRRLVRHGLRTLVKAGDPGALAVLGYKEDDAIAVASLSVEPQYAVIGSTIRIRAEIGNTEGGERAALVDLRLEFARPRGRTSAKVFKGRELHLGPGESALVVKKVSLAQHSTRRHYPGEHRVAVLVNGRETASLTFEVGAEDAVMAAASLPGEDDG